MGGTSTDVAIIQDGNVRSTSLQFLDRHTLATPMIDVTTVGAGGGSIGWKTRDGALQVGPQSAGAEPGPACYGRDGTEPTVTDANLVLGLIDADGFQAGGLRLERELAERSIASLAADVGLSLVQASGGIFRVANAVMADAIRLRTVFAGLDPRNFALLSFGGAGGLHCAAIARDLQIRRVIVPRMASVFSALGLVSTDVKYSYARSIQRDLSAEPFDSLDFEELNAFLDDLERKVSESLDGHTIPAGDRALTHSIELSYRRQILNFEVASPSRLHPAALSSVVREFDALYGKVYGSGAAAPEHGYSLKTLRVTGLGRLSRPLPIQKNLGRGHTPKPISWRMAIIGVSMNPSELEPEEVPVYAGEGLWPGVSFVGPALVNYSDTTVLVPNLATASIDAFGNLVLDLTGREP